MGVVEATSGSGGLAAVCRAALEALDADRITVWKASLTGDLFPYVAVARAPRTAGRRRHDAPAAPIATGNGEQVLLQWADTPTGDPVAATDVVGGRQVVVVEAPATGTGRFAQMAAATGMGSAYCRRLGQIGPLGLLVVEPSGVAGGAAIDVLAASATSWLAEEAAAGGRSQLELVLEITEATTTCSPLGVLRLACRRMAQLLGVRRASILSEDEFGSIVWLSEMADGSLDAEGRAKMRATAQPFPLVAQVLSSGRPAIADAPSSLIGPWWGDAMRMQAALAVPMGGRSVLVLDHDRPVSFRPDQVRLVVAVVTQLGEAARSVRHERKRAEHEAASGAFRQLLEAGVRAGTPMEAAEALAATAAKVLGLPVACAYLVDDAGRVSDVATVGAAPDLVAALRRSFVGRLAAESPVWRRTVEQAVPGPVLIADTRVDGVVRPGGVADVLGLQSVAAIPLMSSDGPLGLVFCGGPQPRERWRSDDRTVLEQLALEGTVVVDNARLRQSERHEASHDALTGLLNRRAFMDRFRDALATSAPQHRPFAVLVLDLDRFKQVNDHLGHHCGDGLLLEVARRVRRALAPADVAARMGGDEFALLLVGEGDRRGAQARAVSILAALEQPVLLGKRSLRIAASIGVALAPAHGEEADGLLRRADLAMYSAKRSGRGHEVYGPATQARPGGAVGLIGELGAHGELGLLGELRHALQGSDGLFLHYQPKVDLRSGRADGAEALVRWSHPVHGLLGPDYFVPAAEESGVVRALTAWVVPKALAQLRVWRDAGVEVCMAVNISARDVNDPEIETRFAGWLGDAGLPGSCLVVEVTESSLMGDGAHTRGALQRIRALGTRVSLDDFGTGYSSLAYLESLPVDEIKIDRRFLRPDHSGRSVIRSIIALGHDLGLRVVAEGVENAEHAAWLADAGCDQAQGYYFAEPLDADGFGLWWARHADTRLGSTSAGTPVGVAGAGGLS